MYAKISSKNHINIRNFCYNGEPNIKGTILDLKIFQFINWLECSNSNLGSIINVNKNVIYIDCTYNFITELNNLPEKLNTLNCSNNSITELNDLPEKLKKLICSNNKITELNNLPSNLEYLDCSNNNIQKLDNLPLNIKDLVIGLNMIDNFDYLPESLKVLVFHDKYGLWKEKELNLENFPISLEIIHFDTNNILKIIGNTTNWEFKKNHITRKKYPIL